MSSVDSSLFDLFREEVRAHTDALSAGLLELEAGPGDPQRIEPLMRAAHSLKGAARIVGIDLAVRLAHSMEDALVAAQTGRIRFTAADIDVLLRGTDILAGLAKTGAGAVGEWSAKNAAAVGELEPILKALQQARSTTPSSPPQPKPVAEAAPVAPPKSGTRVPATPLADIPPAPTAPNPVAISSDPLPAENRTSMFDLFREEMRANLLPISQAIASTQPLAVEPLQEALRQIRGAARIVKCGSVDQVAMVMEALLAAMDGRGDRVTPALVGWFRFAIDTLAGSIATDAETFPTWLSAVEGPLKEAAEVFRKAASQMVQVVEPEPAVEPPSAPPVAVAPPPVETPTLAPVEQAVVRVTASSLNRLMGLAGESLVQARWLQPFSTALLKLRKHHDILAGMLEGLSRAVDDDPAGKQIVLQVAEARRQSALCRQELTDQTADFDDHAARAEDLNTRLYREVIVSRMRPFGDGLHGLPRMVRDMARSLGKQARMTAEGESTEVDRDVLEKLEAPLAHLIRNAVDHGLETPDERSRAGKPEVGTIRVKAFHRAGMLLVSVSDDGHGVDPDALRKKIVARGLSSPELVRKMSDAELLEFLFLPGFSTAANVTEFSGRGVGLDVVQDAVRKIGGIARFSTTPGRGSSVHMQLPITLSVLRAVVVEIAGEPYALPHTRIDRLLRVPRADVRSLEHRQFVAVDGQNVGLVFARQMLDLPGEPAKADTLPVVLVSDATGTYGLVVDAFLGEQDLVVRPLDPRLGKVPNLSAAAILEDGSPVLIVDVEDLSRSMDQFIQTGSLRRCEVRTSGPARKKRILVVDDSITVREVERQLLLHQGYEVAVAVDGVDGWNQVRADKFDLLVSDVDMPRMTGLQLVQAVRAEASTRDLPVVIVSYKEREEDRAKGMEVGANAYLTKSSFHDNRFVRTVEDLIGPA